MMVYYAESGHGFQMTPSDSVNESTPPKFLLVTLPGGGDVTFTAVREDGTTHTITLPHGQYYFGRCVRVNATGLTGSAVIHGFR